MKKLLLATAVLLGLGGHAFANPMLEAVSNGFYGPYDVTIAQGATGAGATATLMAAGYHITAGIGLTNASNIILYDVQTANDTYVFSGARSGDGLIGKTCVAGTNESACIVIQDMMPTSLLPTITALNGGSGICCGNGALIVTAVATVPEPLSMAVLGVGLIGLGAARRQRA